MQDLLIANFSSLPAGHLQDWLAGNLAADTRWTLCPVQSLPELAADLDTADERPRLLVYDPLERALLAALMRGTDPLAVLETWERAAEALLQFWRARRQSVMLAAADLFCGDPALLRGALGRRTGLSSAGMPGPEEEPEAGAAIWQLIADQPRVLFRRLRRICDELAVGGAARPAKTEDMDLFLAAVTGQRALAARAEEVQGLRQQAEDLRKALRETEETSIARIAALEAEFTTQKEGLDQRRTRAETEAARAAAQAAKNASEARAATTQLAQVRLEAAALEERATGLEEMAERVFRAMSELEAARHQLAALEQQLEVLHSTHTADARQIDALAEESRLMREQAQAQERRVAEFYASTSWRITAPLRATRRLFKE